MAIPLVERNFSFFQSFYLLTFNIAIPLSIFSTHQSFLFHVCFLFIPPSSIRDWSIDKKKKKEKKRKKEEMVRNISVQLTDNHARIVVVLGEDVKRN